MTGTPAGSAARADAPLGALGAPAAPAYQVRVPALYDVEIGHQRYQRLRRVFRHRLFVWLVDLDDLPRLPWWLRFAARFCSADHLGDPRWTIRQNVDAWLASQGVQPPSGRVLMLAQARSFGYLFNPITVYWCFSADGELAYAAAEVHNTYHERHCYLLRPDPDGSAEVDKEFYVSPFLTLDGRYRIQVPVPGQRLSVTVALRQHGAPALVATMRGTRRPANPGTLLRMLLRRPLTTYRTSVLIRWHGIALWLRRVPVIRRPTHTPREARR